MSLFRFRYFLFFLCVSLCNIAFGFSLGDKFENAEVGDYIVTQQDKNYSLLLVRSIDPHSILLEEVSLPIESHSPKLSWKEWMQKGAGGHTSWIMYEIDPSTYDLIEAYSFTKRGWLYLDDSQLFFSKLLSLQLQSVPEKDRKKIGPPPSSDEPDRRALWNPSIKVEGKKSKVVSEVWKGRWPKDDSLLSSCEIQLYFNTSDPKFPFPHWIEASNGHYNYAIRAVDAGKYMSSSLLYTIPHRPPQIAQIKKKENSVTITLKSPRYYKEFQVYVFDITRPYQNIGPIPFTLSLGQEKNTLCLDIPSEELNKILTQGHHYKWLIMPAHSSILFVESEDFFRWPNIAPK